MIIDAKKQFVLVVCSIILAAFAVVLFLASFGAVSASASAIMKIISILCFATGAAGIIFSIVMRTKSRHKVFNSYSCPRCGYAPNLQQLESGSSRQCPRCNQMKYEDK